MMTDLSWPSGKCPFTILMIPQRWPNEFSSRSTSCCLKLLPNLRTNSNQKTNHSLCLYNLFQSCPDIPFLLIEPFSRYLTKQISSRWHGRFTKRARNLFPPAEQHK